MKTRNALISAAAVLALATASAEGLAGGRAGGGIAGGGLAGGGPGLAINWYTIDSGGGTSVGPPGPGSLVLSGTIGQWDARPGPAGGALTASGFSLVGGFWPAFTITACGPADIGRVGGVEGPDGQLDNNDFIVFIGRFFSSNMGADFGSPGGFPGPDGVLDNNDFIAFIGIFFAGC